ncbi:Hypothetical predicted protein [Lecanosticta acicola]|uniref:Uncharacterized protein n=1 Tax=Lecanosticta acicola TaxID=111012 RepID=A0AAI8YYK7_9PEZI|nr:Hypothetical predicted protein [Lecanosticta acicola]
MTPLHPLEVSLWSDIPKTAESRTSPPAIMPPKPYNASITKLAKKTPQNDSARCIIRRKPSEPKPFTTAMSASSDVKDTKSLQSDKEKPKEEQSSKGGVLHNIAAELGFETLASWFL